MTDQIGKMSLKELGSFDFNNVNLVADRAEAKALLGNPGRVSIDDNGRLTLVNPNAKPDNGFVRFFKGLFNPAYRAEQRVLNRVDVLARNQSFNEVLIRELVQHSKPEVFGKALTGTDKASVQDIVRLAASHPASGTVNPQELKSLVNSTANRFDTVLSPAARGIFDGGFAKADVSFKGQAGTAYDFVSKMVTLGAGDSHDGRIPQAKEVGTAVVKLCAFSPEAAEFLLPKADSERMRVLISEPNISGVHKDELATLSKKAMTSFLDKLNSMTQDALDSGCDPKSIANLINDALWLTVSCSAADLENAVFDAANPDSIAHKLAVLPEGLEPVPMEADTRARLDAIKAKLPELNDAQAAKAAAFIAANDGMSIDSYAEYAQLFKEAGKDAMRFGTGSSNYGLYRSCSNELKSALERYQTAHPDKKLSTDDFLQMGSAAAFHISIMHEADELAKPFAAFGPEVHASLDEIVMDAASPEFAKVKDSQRGDLAILSQFMGAVLHTTCSIVDGRDGSFAGKPGKAGDLADLALMDRVLEPQMQEAIQESVADVDPKYQDGLKTYLEGALMDKASSSHRPVKAEELQSLKQQALNDPKFMTLLNAQPDPIGAEDEVRIRGFLGRDPSWGLANSLADSLAKLQNFDADGFHNVFDADVKRYLFTEISGQPVGNDPATVREMFKAIVPQDFIPAMSTLCMQGGLLASLSTLISMPQLSGDDEHYDLPTLATTYRAATMMAHSTQLRREDDILFLTSQIEMQAAGMKAGEIYGRQGLSVEVAVNLRGGLDEHGVPNSISIVNIGRDPVRR